MTHKKFSLLLIGAAFLCAAGSILFWHLVTRPVFYGYDAHGDLARLGSIKFNPPATKNITYQKHHTELRDYFAAESKEQIPVFTVGDSFSDGVGGAYYQDYLADKYDVQIVNSAGTQKYRSWAQVQILMKLGYLEQLGVKTLVYEIGERGVFLLNSYEEVPLPTREEYEKDRIAYKEPTSRDMVPPYAVLTTTMGSANVKFIKNRLYAHEHEYAAAEEVLKEYLTIPAFSNPGQENVLYYYRDDLDYLKIKPNAVAVNDTLNRLSDELAALGIRLVFFIAPDKSDVYFPYIARDRDIPENNFTAEFNLLPKKYTFVDGKSILRRAVANGEQDLYWADDTHWSWKAQQLVGDAIYKTLAEF